VDPDEFARRFRQEILPLLQEYCYADYAALTKYLGPGMVDEAGQTLIMDVIGNTESLLLEIEKEFITKSDHEG
jgi:5-methylcytosine-specific restriction protein B